MDDVNFRTLLLGPRQREVDWVTVFAVIGDHKYILRHHLNS